MNVNFHTIAIQTPFVEIPSVRIPVLVKPVSLVPEKERGPALVSLVFILEYL